MANVYINKISKFLPNSPISNDEMEEVLGQIGGKPSRARRIVLKSNGIKQRYYVMDKEQNICYSNAEITANAIRNLNFNLDNLDCLVCGTTQADQIMPNHAVMVHGELEAQPCEVIATAGICLSGMTALKYAYMSIKCEESQTAITTGSETASTILHAKNFKKESEISEQTLNKRPEVAFEKDFLRWMLSDGAGAMLLQNKPNKNELSLKINWLDILSFANEMEVCMYSGGDKIDNKFQGYKEFTQDEWLHKSLFVVKQDVKLLNAHIADITIEKALETILKKRDLKSTEIDWFLPHYSSHYFRNEVTRSLNNANFPIPEEKWFTNLSSCGNTGSASIYIMLEELFNSKKLTLGEKVLCYVPESGRFSSSFMLLEVV